MNASPTRFVVDAPRNNEGSAYPGIDAAFRAAIKAGGGDIILPHGEYQLPYVYRVGAGHDGIIQNINVIGEGRPLVRRTGDSPGMLHFPANVRHCSVRNVRLDGSINDHPAEAAGMVVEGSFNRIAEVQVQDFPGFGILIASPDEDHDAVYNSVLDSKVERVGKSGIGLVGAHFSRVSGNWVTDAAWEGIGADIGKLTDGTDWSQITNNFVSRCAESGVGGIGLDGCRRVLVAHNWVWDTHAKSPDYGNGICVQNNIQASDNLIIVNNFCWKNSGYGVRIKGPSSHSRTGTYGSMTGEITGKCHPTINPLVDGNILTGNGLGAALIDSGNPGNTA